ncbi:MAG TPA: branched-chain amino acid ABC transporter substrate-binding protein [Alphaproteobacteria bacterium]|nr:branched-chain amino acid ABC transporter substrate-binding protein [Alphaproteobacteria bacterium]
MSYIKTWAIATLAVAALTGTSAVQAETKGPVTDPIGVLAIPKGAPIQFGGYWVMSGADSALGIDAKRGVEIAFKDHGGKLLGHPLKINVEDDLCNAEGGQTAATKLAANPNTAIVLGSACSSAATPAAPILWKAGITDIGTADTAPSLTAADRKPEYDGFMRTCYSDIDQGAADAKYVYGTLKAKKIVTIHDGSPYAQQLAMVMGDNFKKMGGTVLSVEAVAPTDVDMHPVLTRIATEKPDVIYAPIFVAAGAQLLRQSKEIPGLAKVPLIGSSGMMAPDMIEAARESIVGFKITYPDVSPEAMGKGYPKLVEEYKKEFGEAPISGYHANAYDAAELAMKGIEKVAKTDASGTTYIGRKALRDALLKITFEGTAGPIKCDAHGQCAQFKPAVYEFTNGDPKTFKIGENPKKIWP